VVLECFVAAERPIAILAVEGLIVHRRVLLVLFECFFGAEKAIASLAVDFLVMHRRVPFVLFECFLAGKITTAENAVVHSVDNCSLLFVRIVGRNTSYNGKDVSFRTAESLNIVTSFPP
jgi:archaellum biogenesis protein FlaJ (TadC family)